MKILLCSTMALILTACCCGCVGGTTGETSIPSHDSFSSNTSSIESIVSSSSPSSSEVVPIEPSSSSTSDRSDLDTPSETASSRSDGALEEDAFYEEVLCTYGARWHSDENGKSYLQEVVTAPYSWDPWVDTEDIPPFQYIGWYRAYLDTTDLSDAEFAKRYASPFGEGTGWFFPQEEFENAIQQYFAVSTEHLRSDPTIYHADQGGYQCLGGGVGDLARITLDRVESEGDLHHLHLTLTYLSLPDPVERVLTIRVRSDERYQFASYTEA